MRGEAGSACAYAAHSRVAEAVDEVSVHYVSVADEEASSWSVLYVGYCAGLPVYVPEAMGTGLVYKCYEQPDASPCVAV